MTSTIGSAITREATLVNRKQVPNGRTIPRSCRPRKPWEPSIEQPSGLRRRPELSEAPQLERPRLTCAVLGHILLVSLEFQDARRHAPLANPRLS